MLITPGDGADGDGLVFLSYSHDDVAWAQRFRVLLKPLVRRKHLRLWDDTAIRVGDEWHPEIEEAIGRSRIALVLVSADFLASDYIMDHELPTLWARGVMLAPVLIGDCFWSAAPELAAVQWLHDPGRDGPLGLHAGNPAERDRRIHRACDRLLTVIPAPEFAAAGVGAVLPPSAFPVPPPAHDRPPAPAGPRPGPRPSGSSSTHVPHGRPLPRGDDGPPAGPPPVAGPSAVVADVPEGEVPGVLSRVPALPPRYVVRDELDGLVDAVVGTAAGGAVGLTGEPAGVGLHGIGGIGKSVLAAALATDDRVRRRFPDGVYWVTVGERPDVLALQLDLLSRLGARPGIRTPTEATAALRAALAEKRVLLVVDDVWSHDAAQAFRVTGPYGRLLYTTRDQAVVAAAGATAHRVGVLSPTAARALAGEVLAVPAATLPPAADRAFAAVGHVPLAVALLAAAVRSRQVWEQATDESGHNELPDQVAEPGGPSWEEIAADLARDADVYGTHPYATTFRALHIAVAALPADLRSALLGLAVFPPDSAIPVAAIARYWAHTRDRSAEEAAADLDRLVAAEVLQRDGGDTIGFHDLAHEYLLLHADALPGLHALLLDAYRGLLDEPDQWWTLPVGEPYVWEHLAGHLAGAGDRDTLVATVVNPGYQAQRIARDGPHAGEADLAIAARLLPENSAIAWWRAWLGRHGHLVGGRLGTHAQLARTAATMLAWLEADPSRPAEVRPDRLAPLLPQPYLAVHGGLRAESSALIRVLAGHTGRVLAVGWSPDGSRLATADDGGTVRIWNPNTGEPLRHLTCYPSLMLAVAWSATGTRLAAVGTGGTVRVWDPITGAAVTQLTGHPSGVQAVAWSPDGTHLATAGTDGTARVWDPITGAIHVNLTAHIGRVLALAWSPDGTQLATAGGDGTARIWDPTTGEIHRQLTAHPGWVLAVAWSPDGTHLATAGTDGTVRLWDPTTGEIHRQLTAHPGGMQAVAWSPDGTRLATAGTDATVRIWDPTTGTIHCQLTGHPSGVLALAWSPDGTYMAAAGDGGTARIWNPATATAASAEIGGVVTAAAWSADGARLATGRTGHASQISGPTDTLTLTGGINEVLSVAWSPDGSYLATAEASSTVRLWATGTGRALGTLRGHTDWVRAAAWSPVGTLLATAGDDKTIRLWELSAPRRRRPGRGWSAPRRGRSPCR